MLIDTQMLVDYLGGTHLQIDFLSENTKKLKTRKSLKRTKKYFNQPTGVRSTLKLLEKCNYKSQLLNRKKFASIYSPQQLQFDC